jgi:HK97 family phage major capsid protein
MKTDRAAHIRTASEHPDVLALTHEHNALKRDWTSVMSELADENTLADKKRELKKRERELEEQMAEVEAARDRLQAILAGRGLIPPVGGSAVPRGFSTGESTYRPDQPQSFVHDLIVTATPGMHDQNEVQAAGERLRRNQREAADVLHAEFRDVTTGNPGSGSFIPPLYMGDDWIDKERAGRKFADAIPKMPLPEHGKTMDFPRTQTSPEAEVQAAEADAVNEVDFDSETYSVDKVTIAGQSDHTIQSMDWSLPGMDRIIIHELVRSYDQKLDYQLLYGTGANGQHRGLKNIAGIIPESFSSGGADDLLGKIYTAVSDISTQAPGYVPNAIVMHPRRAAWIASHRDTDTPLLQQGTLDLASGQQDRGFAGTIAGLGVLVDSNISTLLSTTQDDIYVVDLDQLILAEGPLRTRVLTEVLSSTLEVRIQAFGYTAFAGARRPKVIARIYGAGLTTPAFPSS